MHKRHAPSEVAHLTLCGYEATPSEYDAMKRMRHHVNCKRCLDIAEQRELMKRAKELDATK